MEYEVVKDYRYNDALRHSFDELAAETFGLSFESWYQNGFWKEKYNPYSIVIGGEVVSNVSVSLIDCELNRQARRYVQLGTVMTKKSHRNKGYNRILMERVLRDYAYCDGFFLFANDSVLDYYPAFGFCKAREYRYRAEIGGVQGEDAEDAKKEYAEARYRYRADIGGVQTEGLRVGGTGNGTVVTRTNTAEPVPMETEADWRNFLQEKNRRIGNGVLRLRTDGLLMFYLTRFMGKSVYYIGPMDAYVLAERKGDELVLYEVFSRGPADLMEICRSFGAGLRRVSLAFVPVETEGLEEYEHKEANTTLFLRGRGIVQDMKTIRSIPDIAHT